MTFDKNKLEELLNENKPAEVLEILLSYKGKESFIFFIKSEAYRLLGKFEEAINTFREIHVYKDSNYLIEKCRETIKQKEEWRFIKYMWLAILIFVLHFLFLFFVLPHVIDAFLKF